MDGSRPFGTSHCLNAASGSRAGAGRQPNRIRGETRVARCESDVPPGELSPLPEAGKELPGRKAAARPRSKDAARRDRHAGRTCGCGDRLTPDSSSWPTSPPRARRPASPEGRKRRRAKPLAAKVVVNPAHSRHLHRQARLRNGRGSGLDKGWLIRSPKK